jgi:hypothetical protein
MKDLDSQLIFEAYTNWYKSSELYQKLEKLKPLFVKAAQEYYNSWDQDATEYGDHELGMGGICQNIAEEISNVCSEHNIDCITISAEMGEQHVWAIAYDEEVNEAFEIDISPYTYETGGGYNWKKIPDVEFELDDIQINYVLWDDFKDNLEYY